AVFVPSEFTRRAIAPLTAAPVIVVPHPVTEKPATEGMRQKFGIEEDAGAFGGKYPEGLDDGLRILPVDRGAGAEDEAD
ncbi:hypothetical protein ACC791_37700, partial [Rhizobium ruizarguesonis]